MTALVTVVAASVTTFVATNVDDFLLLVLFFARRIPTRQVIAGQYLGFLSIVGISLLGLWTAFGVAHACLRFLGIVPLLIGIKELLRIHIYRAKAVARPNMGVLSIAAVTLANGADNIGVYIPFFTITHQRLWLVLTVYAVLVPLLCFAGRWLGRHDAAVGAVDRFGHWLVPLVFIGLGILVLRLR